jgi:Spy/CpxP family protein refolding chaperone
MKTRQVIFGMAFMGIMLMAASSFAQNRSGVCNIPNLTSDQSAKIEKLCTTHQTEMDALRSKKIAATSWEAKGKIQDEMETKRTAHFNQVKTLLTPEQQKYFDENQNGRKGNFACNGNGRGKGNGNGNGRRGGNCCGGRGR